jgi:hypothetical protein
VRAFGILNVIVRVYGVHNMYQNGQLEIIPMLFLDHILMFKMNNF